MKKAFSLLMLTLVVAFSAFADNLALVIGNGGYDVQALNNPVNDANDVYQQLKTLGFKATLATNLPKTDFDQALKRFLPTIQKDDTVLFYYAGHAIESFGVNYLIPIDNGNTMISEIDDSTAVNVNNIIAGFQKAERFILILDSCRNNPLKSNTMLSRGLSIVRPPKESEGLIVYATEPGNFAFDGTGRNSYFTQALLKYLQTPNLDVELMLRKVREDVKTTTKSKQIPWTSSSLVRPFYFKQVERKESDMTKVLVSDTKESLNAASPTNPTSICLKIVSLELQQRALQLAEDNRMESELNTLRSWYTIEYARRIKNAPREAWMNDRDFDAKVIEAKRKLDEERTQKESALVDKASGQGGDQEKEKTKLELNKYYNILKNSIFVVKSSDASISNFDTDNKVFAIAIKSKSDDLRYETLLTYKLDTSGDIGKQYNEFNRKAFFAEIEYLVKQDQESSGRFLNYVTRVRLLDAKTGNEIAAEKRDDAANAFIPGRGAVGSYISTRITVITNPDGAQIFVDGVEKGISPMILTDIEPGKRSFEAAWGGARKAKTLEVIEGMNGSIEIP
jgi:hypothetical protein